jgi:hypothetical protein
MSVEVVLCGNRASEGEFAVLHELDLIEERLRCRLGGRILELHLVPRGNGLVLRGRSYTYYAKQLAQHAVMEATETPLVANEIEVF